MVVKKKSYGMHILFNVHFLLLLFFQKQIQLPTRVVKFTNYVNVLMLWLVFFNAQKVGDIARASLL